MTNGCVLILDDEVLVAMLLADYLEVLEWSLVETVMTVEEALAVIDCRSVQFAILDCDLGDETWSWEVADQLARKGVPFLFSSGLSSEQLPDRFAGRPLLAKPYNLAALTAAIATLTD